MEALDNEELSIKRKAKKHFEICLNLLDKDELLEAITAIEKAINLQPRNERFIEFSEYLKKLLLLSMEDSFESPQTWSSSIKQESCHPLKKNYISSPRISSDKKGSKCSSSCKEKHNIYSSEIPEAENPEQFKSFFDNIDKKEELQNGNSDCEKSHWFPNPAKYNVEGFDIDARFLEEVCKQRENADGWDTYMKLLSDVSQDDEDTSDGSDNNDDINVQNIGSINECSAEDTCHSPKTKTLSSSKACKIDEVKRSRIEPNSPCKENGKTTKTSENCSFHSKSTKEASENDDKERLYFMNGKGLYGIPPSAAADTTSDKPTKSKPTSSKPKMDPSENDFYKNLRFYFNVYGSKSDFMNRNKEAASKETSSTKQHFTSDASEKPSSAKDEEDKFPSKKIPSSESDRSTPLMTEEKYDTGSSNTHKLKTMFDQHQEKVTEKAEIPKRGNSSDTRKGKKGSKNRVASEVNSNGQQTTTRTKLNKKQKHNVSEKSKENKPTAGNEKTTRMKKEEKVKKKIPNNSETSEIKEWNGLQTGKKCCVALLWMVYYAVIILLIALIFALKCLYSIIKFFMEIIMSWTISIIVLNKLSFLKGKLFSMFIVLLVWLIGSYYSCKARCIRWYYGIRTLGVKRFFFGSGRPAQTYNLPNSGEDAIQQLLLKRNSDPYSILGVPNDASNDDIRKQYRKLAVFVHPDKNSHLHAPDAFRVLSGAYDIIGDPEKRLEFDREVARREAFQGPRSQNPPRDFSDPREVFAEFLRQMEEIRESLSCDVCEDRHRRILTDRNIIYARHCYHCNRMHPAKEGDFWKESTYLGFGRSKFYACMEGRIYDISEWGHCQELNGFSLPPDTHKVLGRISTRSRHHTPPTSRFEEEFWRDLFGQPDRYDGNHGNHGNQGNRNRQQRQRRKKRR